MLRSLSLRSLSISSFKFTFHFLSFSFELMMHAKLKFSMLPFLLFLHSRSYFLFYMIIRYSGS